MYIALVIKGHYTLVAWYEKFVSSRDNFDLYTAVIWVQVSAGTRTILIYNIFVLRQSIHSTVGILH
jgi:hypothetical protein